MIYPSPCAFQLVQEVRVPTNQLLNLAWPNYWLARNDNKCFPKTQKTHEQQAIVLYSAVQLYWLLCWLISQNNWLITLPLFAFYDNILLDPLGRFSFVQSYCILHLTVAFPVKYFFKLLAVLCQYKKSYWAVSLQYFDFYCSKEKVLKPILILGTGPVLLILAHPWWRPTPTVSGNVAEHARTILRFFSHPTICQCSQEN